MLKDLNQLALDAKRKSTDYTKKEFVFSDAFKIKFKQLPTGINIDFQKYTSIVKTQEGLIIIVPNQWFVIASFFVDYLISLKEYKSIVNRLNIGDAVFKTIRDSRTIDSETEAKIIANLSDLEDAEKVRKFLSDYSWWFGYKTIDRSDYFASPILNLAGVVNVTQAYIADLANLLCSHNELVTLLKVDYSLYLETNISLLSSKFKNTIFYGSPGTGKSYKVNEILNTIERKYYERITFHPEYDHHSFVGGYKPISLGDRIMYKFVPQVFTNIYVRAWQDPENQYYLAIEEINRGNCAEIFGDIFQLLDRKSGYDVTPSTELLAHLIEVLGPEHNGIKSGLKLPANLALLATMNTSDQSLFPMDSAFKRRWDWEYIPIDYDKNGLNASSKYVVKIENDKVFNWIDFIKEVNAKIKHNENLGMDKCIGNYFIKPDADEISLKEFINKAIFYLWNDVFKDEEDSIFAKGIHYEDFFPIETKGKIEVEKILKDLTVVVSESKSDAE